MRLATYNIKHASLKGIAAIGDVLAPLRPDVVALQEVDVHVDRSGRVDQVRQLAARLELSPVFARAFALEGGNYGVALLTRWPPLAERVTPLPSVTDVPPASGDLADGAEPRVLLEVDVAHPGGLLTVAVTHLGLVPRERLDQAATLLDRLHRPRTILTGDLNEGPGAAAFERLLTRFADGLLDLPGRATFPASAPVLEIDHVLHTRDLPAPHNVRKVPADASDHLPVLAEFVVPLRP